MRKQPEESGTFPGWGSEGHSPAWPGPEQPRARSLLSDAAPLAAQNSTGSGPAPVPLPLPRPLPAGAAQPWPEPVGESEIEWPGREDCGNQVCWEAEGGYGAPGGRGGGSQGKDVGWGGGGVGGLGARDREGETFRLTHTQAPDS